MEVQIQGLTPQEQFVIARSKLWTSELDKLLRRWKRQVEVRRRGHYNIARKWNRFHYILGVPVTVVSTLTSTGTLATFRNCTDCDDLNSTRCQADQWIRLVIGITGLVGVILVSVMTFINYQEAANDHKGAADNYESLYGTIESLLIVHPSVRGDPVSTLQNIRSQYNDTVRKSPNLPSEYQVGLSFRSFDDQPQLRRNVQTLNPDDVGFVCREDDQARRGANILRSVIEMEGSSTGASTPDCYPVDHHAKERIVENNNSSGEEECLITTDSECLEAALRAENDFDSEDEDREVCICFDIDRAAALNTPTATALAVANIDTRRDRQVQNSLLRALEFEMQRLDGTSTPPLVSSRKIQCLDYMGTPPLLSACSHLIDRQNTISRRGYSTIEPCRSVACIDAHNYVICEKDPQNRSLTHIPIDCVSINVDAPIDIDTGVDSTS